MSEKEALNDLLTLPPLPLRLSETLCLRTATTADADALAAFNVRIHSDEPDQPEAWLGDWTRDLLSGEHPTTSAADFTVVEDTANGAIASTCVLIPQTWTYDGMPFGVGRIELVGTDVAYRRKGLVRAQMNVLHARSAARGHQIQAITGIPWYYRQFGYEMTVNLGGGRSFFWDRPGNDKQLDEEPYTIRPATVADIPLLETLYTQHTAHNLLTMRRSADVWRWGLEGARRETLAAINAFIITTVAGEEVAYVDFRAWGAMYSVGELGVKTGHSWREVALFVTRELRRRAEEHNGKADKKITHMYFHLGEAHPVYEALWRQLEQPRQPYAWYLRASDIQSFVRLIRPVLEQRLADSVMAGFSGDLRINLYHDTLRLCFVTGSLQEVGHYEARHVEDGDAFFPDLTFLQLLFGYRSREDLDDARADCFVKNAGAHVLLQILFPRRPSKVNALN